MPEPDLPRCDPLVPAVGAWLSARWLPSAPWVPDPAWLDVELATPAMAPASLSVLTSLFVAMQTCKASLGLDLSDPVQVARLPRIVATLNARMDMLRAVEVSERPWLTLLQLNAQSDTILGAAQAGVFTARAGVAAEGARLQGSVGLEGTPDVRKGAWRTLLLQVKALAPLIALGQTMALDWRDPQAAGQLSAQVRLLARIALPPLVDQVLVLRLIAALDAAARLKASLGGDPSGRAYARVRMAVERRAQLALDQLPPGVELRGGVVAGLPETPPNPSMLLNAGTMKLASQIDADVLARLDWQVPAYDQLALLTVGLPVAQLAACMTAATGVDPIRQGPCGPGCDAASVMRAAAA